MNPTLSKELLAILQCPITRSPLRLDDDFLVSETGALRYPIEDGIPRLLPDAAILPAGFSSMEEFKEKFLPPSPAKH